MVTTAMMRRQAMSLRREDDTARRPMSEVASFSSVHMRMTIGEEVLMYKRARRRRKSIGLPLGPVVR